MRLRWIDILLTLLPATTSALPSPQLSDTLSEMRSNLSHDVSENFRDLIARNEQTRFANPAIQERWTPPYGTRAMKSRSVGRPWQPGIDKWNRAWFDNMFEICSGRDRASFMTQDFGNSWGPLPLGNGLDIWYVTLLRRGVWFYDFVSVINWGVNPNYQALYQSENFGNFWNTFNPYADNSSPHMGTPWLRTILWVWKGWTQRPPTSFPDIFILIIAVPSGTTLEQIMTSCREDFTSMTIPQLTSMTFLAPTEQCLPEIGASSNQRTQESSNNDQNWPLLLANMEIDAARMQDIQLRPDGRLESFWPNGTAIESTFTAWSPNENLR